MLQRPSGNVTDKSDDLVATLHGRVGDALRVVGSHDDSNWDIAYMRSDLSDAYSTESVNDIADDLVFDAIGVQKQESLYELGNLRATIRLFDDGFVVHVPVADDSGYLVSLDEDADLRGRQAVDLVAETVA